MVHVNFVFSYLRMGLNPADCAKLVYVRHHIVVWQFFPIESLNKFTVKRVMALFFSHGSMGLNPAMSYDVNFVWENGLNPANCAILVYGAKFM